MNIKQELKDRIKHTNWAYTTIFILLIAFIGYIYRPLNSDHSQLATAAALLIGLIIALTLVYLGLRRLLPEGNTEQDDNS